MNPPLTSRVALSQLPLEGEQPNRYDLAAGVWKSLQFSSACILLPDSATAVIAYSPEILDGVSVNSASVISATSGGKNRAVWYCRPGQVITLPAPGTWKFLSSVAVALYKLHSGRCCHHSLSGRVILGWDSTAETGQSGRTIGATAADPAALYVSIRGGALTGTTVAFDTGKNVTASSAQIVAANTSRRRLVVVNDSDTVVYLAKGTLAALNSGYRLNANGGIFVEEPLSDLSIYTGVVYAIHGGTGNKVVTVQEET